eukprot:CAMPEP_0170529880 /NCGR_PEP_ID=MMETSP0209-20121228/34977_1 /TAXON_ID=665100 ORGANISM="Litonotus pictus, Strain P1" /NCGR_SAMPLE_ID=MMETSP0209 /ASSEMBLY_ACC=CAM_ASM_000301 /LENGTH=145 /DNA_ID=CAMNT_0010822365 /DNA_START=261 /DNA_END=695 /DNA_ORIENTATION=+
MLYGFGFAYLLNEYGARNGLNRFFVDQFPHHTPTNYEQTFRYIEHAKDSNLANNILLKDVEYKLALLKGSHDEKILHKENNEDKVMINYYGKLYEKNDMDIICNDSDFLQYGKLMSSVFQEEIAAQCYYIAYLKNRKIQGNSDMK